MQDLFAERLINMSINQGIARLDFARLESVDPQKNQATFTPALRLVMPLDSFMQAVEQMNHVRDDILKQAKAQSADPSKAQS
ncbi:MAG: hypothetical protein HGA21_12260 [Burkholderiaceae bacterium]|jgi:hypothetical protein|nr:hypothetical protein [Burkholderiaceae bacterium]